MRKLARYWLMFVALSAAAAPAAPKSVRKPPPAPLADLAGDYFEGTGHYGTVLTLDRRGRFRFTTSRDNRGVPEKTNRGTALLVNGMLSLKPAARGRVDEAWETLQTRYRPVRWGKRRYLVYGGDEGLLWFCNSINLGAEPRSFSGGFPYLRLGDEKVPVQGWPSLPAKWSTYLLRAPVNCRVTAIGPPGSAIVDAGANAHLREGMVLMHLKSRRQLTVTDVTADTATITVSRSDWLPDNSPEQLAIGDECSTREPKPERKRK